ncbi:MAG: Ig-like domain-containing protein [Chloroflexota bacterium]
MVTRFFVMLKSVRWLTVVFLTTILLLAAILPTLAQEESTLNLRLRRDSGLGMGANIQGLFSMRATGPDTLTRVEFFIDDDKIGEVTTPPFNYQFHTNNFIPGVHTLRATGYTSDDAELASNTITHNFLSEEEASKAGSKARMSIIIPTIVVVVAAMALWTFIASRGQKTKPGEVAINGPFGGAICPKCKRPFARHIWGLNLIVGKYDRCPHCGKWSLVSAAHPDVLEAAYESMQQADATTAPPPDDKASFRRRLDDSQYEK